MRQTIKRASLPVLYVGLILLGSCSKTKNQLVDPVNCGGAMQKIVAAIAAQGQNPTKASCEAAKKEADNLYKSCTAYFSASDKKALDEFLAEPCPQ